MFGSSKFMDFRLKRICIGISLITLVASPLISQAKPTQMPLSISFAAEPNIMLLLDTSNSMGSAIVGNSTILSASQRAITRAIDRNDNTRFCLSIFNNSENRRGSNLTSTMQCSSEESDLDSLKTTLNNPGIVFPMALSGRPLAATFYDISRYFRGKEAYFGTWNSYSNQAINYRCQDNTVVVLSDGEPLDDWPAPVNGSTIILNDTLLAPISEPLEDSPKTLAELSRAATQIDFVPTAENDHALGRTTDSALQNFDEQRFQKQSLETHSLRLNIDSATLSLKEAAAEGGGFTHSPLTENEGLTSIEHIIASASLNPKATGANAAQSAVVTTGSTSNIFITQFDSTDWSGALINLEQTETTNSNDAFSPTVKWNAADLLTNRSADARKIFTQRPGGQAVAFEFDALSSAQTVHLDAQTLDYIRGDRSNEIGNGPGTFRARNTLLGDIIHSSASYVKNFNFGYSDRDYLNYLTGTAPNQAGDRQAMVYVGSNDGMLHAFNADSGQEVFAFIPNTVIPGLTYLTSPNYITNHQYFVDGKMSVVDARLNNKWATVLASPLGAGFKGLFMLNVTQPESNNYNQLFEWEISEQSTGYGAMGYMLNSPKIGRVLVPEGGGAFHEKWLLFVGNGVHSEDKNDVFGNQPIIGKASVYIIDLENGELISEIVLDDGRDDDGFPIYSSYQSGNGVTSVTAVDESANTLVDRLYAADLKGNLWRINYEIGNNDSNANDADYIREHFKIAFEKNDEPAPIFQATGPIRQNQNDNNPTGNFAQAITSEITVTGPPLASNESIGELVFFGTGEFFDTVHLQETSNLNVQSMYAIWDQGGWGDKQNAIDKDNNLSEQTITVSANGEERTFDEVISYDGNILGWYIDLPEYGERIIRQPVSLFDSISFVSQSPLTGQNNSGFDPCIEGATAWSMIARQDTATALLSLSGDNPNNPDPIAGIKQSANLIKDSIYVARPSGKLVSPTIDANNLSSIIVGSQTQIQKKHQRGSWKLIQF